MAQENPPAETTQPDSAAPAQPNAAGAGSPVAGACYTANQVIFDSYQVDFCLTRPGSYSAVGGELTCEGRMSWRTAGRTILGQMHPTQCGAVMFQGAQLDCRPQAQDSQIPADIVACVLYPANPAQRRQVFDASLQTTQ